MKTPPSTEDRIWAVLSHLSALAFGMGILLPVIGWSEQRRKSNYASFQSLQALGYQSLGYTIWIVVTLVIVIIQSFVTLTELITASDSGAGFEGLIATLMAWHFIVMLVLIGFYVFLPVIAAVSCILGRDFRYPLMGRRLAKYLNYDQASQDWLNEAHEDRWVAAMGHFSVIIAMWGMLIPFIAWILQGKRSNFLRFQAMQTLGYQALATLLPFISIIAYMVGFFVFIVITGIGENSSLRSSMGIASLVILLGFVLIAVGFALVVPLFHLLGQYAGYRVLKGDDYRYPVLGKLIEKRVLLNDREGNVK